MNETVDIFLPNYFLDKLKNNNQKSEVDSNLKIKNSFCKHSVKCEICRVVKNNIASCSHELIKIHNQVKDSGKYNFQSCQIPVNQKIDTNFMKRMLEGYNDVQVCDLLKYGFPIELDDSFLIILKITTGLDHSLII